MSEDPRDKAAALAEGMEAAGALIENLEQEVADLRSALDQAAVALKAAQEEVSSRAGALEEKELARVEAEREVEDLRAEISALKQRHSDEQLRISNEHTNEIAELRSRLEEQRRTDVDAASSEARSTPSRKSSGGEREALEARYREEIEALKTASEHWEEQLRTSYQEQEARHAAEFEAARTAAAERESTWRAPSVKPSKGGWPKSGAPRRTSDGGRTGPEKRGSGEGVGTPERRREAAKGDRVAACRARRGPPQLGGTAQRGSTTDKGARRGARERPEEDPGDQARRGERVRRQEGCGHSGSKRGRQQGAQGAPRGGEDAPRARVRGATGGRSGAQEVGDVGTRRAIEGSRPSARDRDARLHGPPDGARGGQAVSEVLLAGGSGAGGRAFRGGDLRFENRITELEGALEESEARRNELEGYSARSAPAVRSRPGSQPGPTMPQTKMRKGLGRTSRRRPYSPRTRSKNWKRNFLRPENRAGATPKNYKEPWKASTGSPTPHAGSGKALRSSTKRAREDGSVHLEGLRTSQGSRGTGRLGSRETDAHVPLGRHGLAALRLRPEEGVEEPRVYITGTGEDPAEVEASSRQPNARMDSRALMIGVQAR